MDIFDALTMIGGLSLFLFGMNIMGQALERRAGGSLRLLLGKLTTGRAAGLFTGLCVTAVIQSSSATTVMVVGFVNSGLMSLTQAINVIMGANIGTTVTAWILSLSGIDSGNLFVRLFFLYTGTGLSRHYLFYVPERYQKERDRRHLTWIRHADVWHGNYVGSRFRPRRHSRFPESFSPV